VWSHTHHAGIIDDPKERKLMTVDDDYEEPLLTVVEVSEQWVGGL
jgi:hypothetical protein